MISDLPNGVSHSKVVTTIHRTYPFRSNLVFKTNSISLMFYASSEKQNHYLLPFGSYNFYIMNVFSYSCSIIFETRAIHNQPKREKQHKVPVFEILSKHQFEERGW